MGLPRLHLMLQPLTPGGAVGQPGEGVYQRFLALLFKVFAIALGLLLHVRYALGQPLQMGAHFLLAGITLLLVPVQRAQQPFKAVFQKMFEAVQVDGRLHAVLHAAEVFAQLGVQIVGGGLTFSMTLTGCLKVVLERLQALVKLFEIGLEFVLTTVSDGQHQDGKIVENRQ